MQKKKNTAAKKKNTAAKKKITSVKLCSATLIMGVVLYFFYTFWVTQIEIKTSVKKVTNQKPILTQLILKKMLNKDEKNSQVNANADPMDKNQMVALSVIGETNGETISHLKKRKQFVFIAVILFIVAASIITWKHTFQC